MRARSFFGAVAAAGLLAVAGAPAQGALPAGNLLQNPGAEAGAAGDDAVVPIPGWTVTGNFTVDAYANGNDLGPDVASAVNGGANYFYGGPGNESSSASQKVDVSGAAAEIDAGAVGVALGGDLGGYSSQRDTLTLRADFLDGSGGTIGSLTVHGPSAADRQDASTLLARSGTATLPTGTRSIVVTMTSTRTDGSDDDGLADNLTLTLSQGQAAAPAPPPAPAPAAGTIGGPRPLPPPKPGAAVDVTAGAGATLVRLPGHATFATLRGGDQIPVGATVDVTHGSVSLASAEGKAAFTGGVFTVREPRSPGAARVTQLTLAGGSLAGCAPTKGRKTSAVGAPAPKVIRQLLGNGHGRFRISGRYASATVRGTVWLVQDRCDGTLVRVRRGTVAVSDVKLHKTVLVKAGHRYLAHS